MVVDDYRYSPSLGPSRASARTLGSSATRHAATPDRPRPLAPRLVLLFGTTTLGLAVALAWSWNARLAVYPQALSDRARELVAGAGGIWDSHPDPDVGRVLMPGLERRKDHEVEVSSN